MKKVLVLIITLVMTLSHAACGGGDTQEVEEMIANPSASGTNAVDWSYQDVTPEQIQAISDVLAELKPLYNEAAAAAKGNGWEADETVVQELNMVYALIDAAKHGVADPSEYEGAEDVVKQMQMAGVLSCTELVISCLHTIYTWSEI